MNQKKPSPEQLWQSILDWYFEPMPEDTPEAPFKNLQEEGTVCLLLSNLFFNIDEYLKNHEIKEMYRDTFTKQS